MFMCPLLFDDTRLQIRNVAAASRHDGRQGWRLGGGVPRKGQPSSTIAVIKREPRSGCAALDGFNRKHAVL
jgi:hypothetical protein